MLSLICHYADRARLDANLYASVRPQIGVVYEQASAGSMFERTETDAFSGNNQSLYLMSGRDSLAAAYAEAEAVARGNVSIFVHEDVKLPAPWLSRFEEAVAEVQRRDPHWAVIGVFGTYRDETGRQHYVGNVRDPFEYRVHRLGECPRRVESVDGMLVAKRRGVFSWDVNVPGFHGYAEDLCCQARAAGAGVWVVNVFTEHNCHHHDLETDAGYQAAKAYVSEKWKGQRPITTTCGIWE